MLFWLLVGLYWPLACRASSCPRKLFLPFGGGALRRQALVVTARRKPKVGRRAVRGAFSSRMLVSTGPRFHAIRVNTYRTPSVWWTPSTVHQLARKWCAKIVRSRILSLHFELPMTVNAFICDAIRTPFGRWLMVRWPACALTTWLPLPSRRRLRATPGVRGKNWTTPSCGLREPGRRKITATWLAWPRQARVCPRVPGATVNRLCGSGLDASAPPPAPSAQAKPA